MTKSKTFLKLLLVAFLVANALVFAIVWTSIEQSRQNHSEDAISAAENLSKLLSDNISGMVGRIDLGLQATMDEIERQAGDGPVARHAIDDFIARQHKRMPEIDALRFADADGIIRYGVGVASDSKVSVADRDYFIRLRDEANPGLVISKPIIGRVSGEWGIAIARRSNRPDGSFGGIVYATILTSRISGMFEQLALGPKGVVSLRGLDLDMVARFPMPKGANGDIGNRTISPEFEQNLRLYPDHGSYIAPTGLDGINRAVSYRRMAAYPAYIIVGLAADDYLLAWRQETHRFALMAALFCLTTTALGWFLWRSWKRRGLDEERVRRLLAEQELILDNAHVGIVMVRQRRIAKCNRRQAEMFGFAGPGEIEGKTTQIFYRSQEQFEDVGNRLYAEMAERGFSEGEVEMRRQDGKHIWVMLTGRPLDPAAVLDGSIWAYSDVSERKRAEAELRIAAAAFESQEGMVVTDANAVILRVNRAFTEATGYPAEEVVGQNPRILKSGRHSADFYREMWESIAHTGGWQGEIWDRRKNGEEYLKWLTISAVKDGNGGVTHYIGTQLDITERKKSEEKIKELAFFDQLTGLPNRTLLVDRLKQAMAVSARSGNYGGLLFIDLDNFKTLNDTLGHDVGDLLLKQVGNRLTLGVREGDTVARLGGDEFVIVLAGLSTDQADAATAVESVAEKVLASLNKAYELARAPHHSTASIGVTLFRGDAASVDELMKQADLAMYKSKEAGRNLVRFFDPTLESAIKERAALEGDLRRALEEQQFLLHYQAQVSAEGQLTGVEALVRWQHPERGLVSPAEFIPAAEESGLILPLGYWVLRTACALLVSWADRPEMAQLTVSVNVSARQFSQANFVDQVLEVLEITGANPQRLKLELTESLLVANVQDVIEKMFVLKASGVGFSLDDFGTGYSSLSYLKRLPLDQLKIDQSFVRDVLTDPNDAAIAKTIVALGNSLGLGVIAEGVETEAQQHFLANIGCYAYQGYLFGRPLPIADFESSAQRV